MQDSTGSQQYCFVSCDIVGHGLQKDEERQRETVLQLNEVVRKTISAHPSASWASGGDGGHLAIPIQEPSWVVIDLMTRLYEWSHAAEHRVPLRITGHVGPAHATSGADDRVQLVGKGINLCGSLLDFGAPGAIVVTTAFRSHMEAQSTLSLAFKDDRTVYLKHFSPERLYLLDIGDALVSEWGSPTKSEHQLLTEALDKKLPWLIIYHAKRLLQSNTNDLRAREALNTVATTMTEDLKASRNGTLSEVNRFISDMDPHTFRTFTEEAGLVERDNRYVSSISQPCYQTKSGTNTAVLG